MCNMVQPSALVSHRGYRDMMFMLVLALVVSATVLTWSSSTSTRYHLALSYMYGVFGVSSAGLAVWLVTGRVAGLYVAMLIKLAICPCCSWLIEVHSALPTVGSVLLSGIYVKLGWIGLAKFGMTGTGAPSTLADVSALWLVTVE